MERDGTFQFRRRSPHPNVTTRARRPPPNVTMRRGTRRPPRAPHPPPTSPPRLMPIQAAPPPPPPRTPSPRKVHATPPPKFTVYNDFAPLSIMSLGLVPQVTTEGVKCPKNSEFINGRCKYTKGPQKGKFVILPKNTGVLKTMR